MKVLNTCPSAMQIIQNKKIVLTYNNSVQANLHIYRTFLFIQFKYSSVDTEKLGI